MEKPSYVKLSDFTSLKEKVEELKKENIALKKISDHRYANKTEFKVTHPDKILMSRCQENGFKFRYTTKECKWTVGDKNCACMQFTGFYYSNNDVNWDEYDTSLSIPLGKVNNDKIKLHDSKFCKWDEDIHYSK